VTAAQCTLYTKTTHRTTQLTTSVGMLSGIRTQSGQTKINDDLTAYKLSSNWEKCGSCPVLSFLPYLPYDLSNESPHYAVANWLMKLQKVIYSSYLESPVFDAGDQLL